jgi:drug/metabolite transporter (DMT)-like permease
MDFRGKSQPRVLGFFWVAISAAAFGAMPIFGRYAYASGITPISLLFFRFLLAAVCMVILLKFQKEQLPRGRNLLGLFLMGVFGYAGQALCYFTALTLISVSLVAILLYLYPIMVMILSAMFLKEKITLGKLLALTLALSGTVMVIGLQIGGSEIGIAWALAGSAIYSMYIVFGARLMKAAQPFASATVVMTGAMISYAVVAITRGVAPPQEALGWLWILCITLLCTVLAISSFFYGLKIIGPVDASLISTFEPVTTVILAFLFLDEKIGGRQLVGMLFILGAAALLALQPATLNKRISSNS